MSTIKHPVGPQSSNVYWRRRLVVGLGLLAVLVIIILIIVRPGSSSGDPASTTPPAATEQGTDAQTDAATPPASGSASGTCNPNTVQVDAITDADSYDPGLLPQLTLSITNTGAAPCTINAGTAAQVFTISSGDDVYWTSTDCQTDATAADVTLEPGVTVSSSEAIAWDRTRSAKDTCDASRDAAPGGGASYYLTVSVDGVESESPTQFLLY